MQIRKEEFLENPGASINTYQKSYPCSAFYSAIRLLGYPGDQTIFSRKTQFTDRETPHSPIALVIDNEPSATVVSPIAFFRDSWQTENVRWNQIHSQHVLSSMKVPKQRPFPSEIDPRL
ncbi:hypothetical protein CEXT_628331 [Caerostris extrusa]|uniref:Uncharacterized protein n=1 Tax=Caerostris extrusa TaxID=172846 RepID=A0AAV4W4H6_CAEEX|nr:hypothetical protein CEXT_628331 [Caerostris extrusa]